MPPPRYIPAVTSDLSIHQQGLELIFEMGYPKTTVSGLSLPGLEAVEIWELALPESPTDEIPRIDPREFAHAAQSQLRLQGPELIASTTGDRVAARILLQEPLPERPEVHVFAVRTVAVGGLPSEYSNQVGLVVKSPPTAPHSLHITPRAQGVEVSWESEAQEAEAFHIYRRRAQDRAYGPAIAQVGAEERSYLDSGTRFGERYIYTVRAIASLEPLVESAAAGEREVDYQDRFAPAPPATVLALGESGQVRLSWEPSEDDDVAGYLVYRQDPGGESRCITEQPVQALEYLDTGLAPRLFFRYQLSAVDQAGNEGGLSSEVLVEVQ